MIYKLDQASADILNHSTDELFLGILNLDSGSIALYFADRTCQPAQRRFPGHEELVLRGIVQKVGVRGFSFQLKQGKMFRFYRNSFLNDQLPFSCLSPDDMDKIIRVIGMAQADDFESYP